MNKKVLIGVSALSGCLFFSGCASSANAGATPNRAAMMNDNYVPPIEQRIAEYNKKHKTTIIVDGRDDPDYDEVTQGYLFEDMPRRNSSILRPKHDKKKTGSSSAKTKKVASKGVALGTVKRIPFPVHEYNNLPRTGKAVVEGKILIAGKKDDLVPAKKAKIYLNPITSYSKQWYEESFLGGNKMTKADKRIYNYLLYTVSEKDGKYSFYNVPKGKYYITAKASCGKECGYKNEMNFYTVDTITVGKDGKVKKDIFADR